MPSKRTITTDQAIPDLLMNLQTWRSAEHINEYNLWCLKLLLWQLARSYVESLIIPGADLTFKPLSWAAPPYSMERDCLPNRAAAAVSPFLT